MRLLIIPEGTDFQTWTCTFDHVSLDTALPEGERPDRERRRRVTGRSPEFGTNFETIVGFGS
jgi:hypothetical protein